MRRTTFVVSTVGLTGALLAGGVATAGWVASGFSHATVTSADPRLDVTGGDVQDVYPGGSRPTQLTVRNLNAFPVDFGTVELADVVVDPNHTSCPPDVLGVDWNNPHIMLLPGNVQTFDVGVTMKPDAPQACAGASFSVDWRAWGTVGTP